MGVVYRARDPRLERIVAIKLLTGGGLDERTQRENLLREARTASALNHPNVCHIYEVGEAGGESFIVMEFVEGKTLASLIPADGLPVEAVIRNGLQVAEALAHAHQRGIIHRDLKAQNVMVTPEGRVKVLDFGLARRVLDPEMAEATQSRAELSLAGAIAGTLHVLSPEVLRGDPADSRSDVWALGVLLYELASGRRPFTGTTGYELTSAILNSSPPPLPPHVPPALRTVIQRCLAKEPSQRYERAGEVRAALEAVSSDSAGAAAVPTPPEKAGAGQRRALLVAGACTAALFLVAAVVGIRKWSSGGTHQSDAEAVRSLAILPFKILSPGEDFDYFGIGLTDTMITRVSQIGAVTVRPTSAVQKYVKREADALTAGRELQVDSVLDGSVQRSGNKLRINVNLLRVRDGSSLWSDTFNLTTADIFAMQDEVSQKVVESLRLRLNPEQKARLSKRYTSNPQAYEFFLKGMQHFQNRNLFRGSPGGLTISISMFEEAIRWDPQYAQAHAMLAYSFAWLALFNDVGNPVWIERARQALEKANTLDPALPEFHIVRYELLWSRFEGFRIRDAAHELLKAQRLDPGVGHDALGVLYSHMGLRAPAVRELQRALEIDPTSDIVRTRMAEVYDLLYLPDDALAFRKRFPVPAGFFSYLRKSYLWKNLRDSARQDYEALLRQNPEDAFAKSVRALLLALQGDFRGAQTALPELSPEARDSRAFHHVTYNFASVYALAGDAEKAVKWLQLTVEKGMPNYTLFAQDPHLDRIRAHPLFQEFMTGLKKTWDEYDREFR
jgi:serine/threonine-protein kinase